MKMRRLVSFVTVFAMCMSLFANLALTARAEGESNVYTADFTQLVKNNADTTYGTADDANIVLDDYTTLNLSYAGTYVSADGKVYIKSGTTCNGDGKYAQGSYIAFTAPSDGELVVAGADIGWFTGNHYEGYTSTVTVAAKAETTYYFGYRKGSTYVGSITFTPSTEPDEPEITATPEPYTSPETLWDFDTYTPAVSGTNVPVISDQAEYDSENKNVKFPAAATGKGTLTVDFDEPINNNVEFEFDSIGHDSNLGQQYINFTITNSEQEEIVSLTAHPYDYSNDYAGKNKLVIGGETKAVDKEISDLFGAKTTHIKITVDYVARTVKAVIGDSTFNGTIPARTMKDIGQFKFWVNRSKTASGRYISLDNLSVKEFTSTAQPATDETLAAYEVKTFANIPSRVKAPSNAEDKPLVIFLSSKSRFGTDNEGQLYQAQYFFDNLTDDATLAAPQTASAWDDKALKAYIAAAKTEYNPSEVVVIGYDEGATAAYLLSDTADKIVPIAGGGNVYGTVKAKYWAFGGFLDDAVTIADIRTPVNALQQAGAKVRYTESPTDGHNILETVGAESQLYDWIKGNLTDKKVVDLFLFSGQSNMAGRGTASEATLAAPGAGYEFHSITDPSKASTAVPYVLSIPAEPFGKNDNNSAINDNSGAGADRRSGDMVGALMSSYYDKTGVPIVGVQASRGGQATNYFTGSTVKAEMAARFAAAEKYLTDAGYVIRKKAVVWCQGEADADAGRSESTYKGNTLTIWNNFKAMGITDMFIVKTGHYNINYNLAEGAEPTEASLAMDTRYASVNTWQQEFADANDNVYAVANLYTDEYLAQMRDQYHYYQPVYNAVGKTAGETIAEIYKDEETPSEPAAKEVVMPEKPSEPSEPEEDIPGVNLSWDFETDQTAASGDNVPVISGAEYDSTNKMVKFAAAKDTKKLTVNLNPAADGVTTAEFDSYLSQLGNTTFNVAVNDGSGNEILKYSHDTYGNTATVTIGGTEVFSGSVNGFVNRASTSTNGGDGISAKATHFKIEVNTAKRVASLTLTGGTEDKTIEGNIDASVTSTGKVEISRVSSNNNTARHIYVDNLKISSYTPAKAIYATGPLSVTKRIGGTTAQYFLSKTYTDDIEEAAWSVSGVTGVTIDSATGILTVPENAGTGTAKVTVELTHGNTLTAGTSSSIDVTIKDFAKPDEYKYDGSSTLEVGEKSQFKVGKVIDTDGNDITEYAMLGGFAVTDTTVAAVTSGGELSGVKAGNTELKFNLVVEKLGYSQAVTVPVKVGAFEITSSDAQIDVSNLINYGADTYRVYKSDKSYTDVTASGGKVANTTGGEVTVVPVYRFNYTNAEKSGYTIATGAYTAAAGYGVDGDALTIDENGVLPQTSSLRVDVPAGRYDITVTRNGASRFDVNNDGYKFINNGGLNAGRQQRPNTTAVMYAPQILNEDGSLNITVSSVNGGKLGAMEIIRVPDRYKKRVVWIAGDSESARYYPLDADGDLDSEKIMMTGFGTYIPKFLDAKEYVVNNMGEPSATVKIWYNGNFRGMYHNMDKGDTLLIDFGINEVVKSDASESLTEEQMEEWMTEIFAAAKEKGAQPVLVSPIYQTHKGSHFKYTDDNTNTMYAFAQTANVPCIDLNKGGKTYNAFAVTDSGNSDWYTYNYIIMQDSLHQTQFSALINAAIIAGGMKKLGYKTTDYSYTYKDISSFGDENKNTRGAETGKTREYSIAALDDYITVNGTDSMIKDFHTDEYMGTPSEPIQKVDCTVTVAADKTVTVDRANEPSAVLIRVKRDTNGGLEKVEVYDNLAYADGIATKKIDDLQNGDELYLWDTVKTMKPLTEKKIVSEITSAPSESNSPIETERPSESNPPAETDKPETYEILFSDDFESQTVGAKTSGSANNLDRWITPAGTVEIKSDSTEGIGKYMTVVSGTKETCRSGYMELPNAVTKDFVFECDYKSTSNSNVSDLILAENKNSIYANHGMYTTKSYVFLMARPKSSNIYVINNKTDDSGLTEVRYTDPVFKTAEITGNPWLHVKVVGNFETQSVIVYITSLDGKTEYHKGVYDMNVGRDTKITAWKCIHLLSPTTNGDTCIDNIVVREATAKDLSPLYHTVTITCGKTTFEQYVLDGGNVVNIPSTAIFGNNFEGWKVNDSDTLLTSAQLASYAVEGDCTVTGQISANYIEAMDSVEFDDFPAGNEIAMGEDENTYGDNTISLKITGEQGTSLVTSPDSRVTDYKIDWTFDGFRTLDGVATGETGSVYCDSYGLIEITQAAQPSVNFKMKRTSANYYGRVTAKVTYNGKTVEVTKPLVILGDKSNTTIIPRAGYVSDFNKYESTMTGYVTTADDIITGGWNTSGSETPSITLSSDNGGKYLRINRTGTNSSRSSYAYQQIGDITGQTVFEQDVRFSGDGAVRYAGGTNTAPASVAFILEKSGTDIKFNGTAIYKSAAADTWYHMVVTADPTSKLTYARVYDMTGGLLGSSDTVAFSSSDYSKGTYYSISPSTSSTVDINNVKIYNAETDASTITISGEETASIPESGSTTVKFTASAKTTDNTDAIGAVTWTVDDELADGVSIASDGTLTITPEASSGNLPIKATIGGKSAIKTIKLTGTKNNVAFTSAPMGIQTANAGEYSYTAELRNGQAEPIEGTVTYSLADADGAEKTYTGVSIDGASGRLTVAAGTQPQTIYVKAVSGGYSKLAKTVLYGMKFSFGSGAKSGYTQVTSSSSYSYSKGFGIEGTATDEASDITGSGVVFKLKLEKGKVYSVKAKYQGTIRCERVDATFTGFERTKSSLAEDTFSVAVFGDDVMDITLTDGAKIETLEITPVTKAKTEKPAWWTIGDSTIQQNGSWAYTLASLEKTDKDLSASTKGATAATITAAGYTELGGVISVFRNSGQAGRQHKSYYTEGLLNNVLTGINPGDVVSISGMGTNDSSSSKEQFKAYDLMYMQAIIDMGGYVILGSYTPTGNFGATEGKVYAADTMTFKGMRTNSYDLAIRELYEEYKDSDYVLGFIDIGKTADDKMTADVKAAYDAASGDEAAKRTAANAKAEEMMAWWKDYNHYYTTFSNYILPDITKAAASLIAEIQ